MTYWVRVGPMAWDDVVPPVPPRRPVATTLAAPTFALRAPDPIVAEPRYIEAWVREKAEAR